MTKRIKLKLARVEKGEVQADVAKVLDISEQTYNRKELGIREFTLRECIILAKHFKKSLDELFFA